MYKLVFSSEGIKSIASLDKDIAQYLHSGMVVNTSHEIFFVPLILGLHQINGNSGTTSLPLILCMPCALCGKCSEAE